jgi:hypothetical protein
MICLLVLHSTPSYGLFSTILLCLLLLLSNQEATFFFIAEISPKNDIKNSKIQRIMRFLSFAIPKKVKIKGENKDIIFYVFWFLASSHKYKRMIEDLYFIFGFIAIFLAKSS